jgi:hypothetical protein
MSTLANGGLNSLNIRYTNSCVNGLDFVYNDGTIVRTNLINNTYNALVNLTKNERLYTINSYCGAICDSIQFKTINTLTGNITTINTGNPAKNLNSLVYIQKITGVTSFSVSYYSYSSFGVCLLALSLNYETNATMSNLKNKI